MEGYHFPSLWKDALISNNSILSGNYRSYFTPFLLYQTVGNIYDRLSDHFNHLKLKNNTALLNVGLLLPTYWTSSTSRSNV